MAAGPIVSFSMAPARASSGSSKATSGDAGSSEDGVEPAGICSFSGSSLSAGVSARVRSRGEER